MLNQISEKERLRITSNFEPARPKLVAMSSVNKSGRIEKIASYLADLPKNHRLDWDEQSLSSDKNFGEGWLDIYVPEICRALELDVFLAIDAGQIPGADLILAYNAQLEIEISDQTPVSPEQVHLLIDGNRQREKLSPALFATEDGSFRRDLLEWYLRSKNEPSTEDADTSVRPGEPSSLDFDPQAEPSKLKLVAPVWTVEKINSQLEEWAESISGRSDISFSFQPGSDRNGREQLRAIRSRKQQ